MHERIGLVFSRSKNEQVIIDFGGRLVVLTVVNIGPENVRLGFLADPKTVAIHRREVYDRIKAEEHASGRDGGRGDAQPVLPTGGAADHNADRHDSCNRDPQGGGTDYTQRESEGR